MEVFVYYSQKEEHAAVTITYRDMEIPQKHHATENWNMQYAGQVRYISIVYNDQWQLQHKGYHVIIAGIIDQVYYQN